LAQYPSNGNQKITLGEQTTADGLIFRGVATDTVRKPSIDTMAYMVLDTTTNIMWHYKKATSNAWLRLNLLPSDTASMLTNYWRSGRFSGTLPVANGGTGANMSSLPNNYLIRTNSSGIFDTSAVYEAGGNVGIGSSNPLSKLQIGDFLNTSGVRNDIIVTGDKVNADGYFARLMLKNSEQSGGSTASIRGERASANAATALTFYTNTTSSPGDGDEKMRITSAGNVGIGLSNPSAKLQVKQNSTGEALRIDGSSNYAFVVNGGTDRTSRILALSIGSAYETTTPPTNGLIVDGNVGIGTGIISSNPLSKLQIGDLYNTSGVRNDIFVTGDKVNADGYFARLMLKNSDQSGGSTASIRGERASTNAGTALTFYTNTTSSPGDGDEKMRITSAGNIGIGTASPQSGYRLHVVDSIYVGGNVSASAYTTRSDFNLKDDIFDLKYGLNEILNLQPVQYTYKSNGSKQLGFIAQDIGTILPEVVSFEESMSVNYQAIIPILTKAIQEQQALIKALEQRIINLENK
jgi:hypothetical protein